MSCFKAHEKHTGYLLIAVNLQAFHRNTAVRQSMQYHVTAYAKTSSFRITVFRIYVPFFQQ